MKTIELIKARPVLVKISQAEGLNGRTAFSIARVLKPIEENIEIFERERQRVIDKYVKRGEDGEPVTVKDKDGQLNYVFDGNDQLRANRELADMTDMDVTIPFDKINFSDIESISLTPSEAAAIVDFVDMDK